MIDRSAYFRWEVCAKSMVDKSKNAQTKSTFRIFLNAIIQTNYFFRNIIINALL